MNQYVFDGQNKKNDEIHRFKIEIWGGKVQAQNKTFFSVMQKKLLRALL